MPEHPTGLLTTRVRTIAALSLTAFVFALAIRDVLHAGHTKAGWLFTSAVLHGWPWVTLNVFFYGFLCWLAFWCIRGTGGTERIFMVGWFASILLSPLEAVRPHWNVAITHIAAIGLAVALLAALALLLKHPTGRSDSNES
jgi:hypothetical protein